MGCSPCSPCRRRIPPAFPGVAGATGVAGLAGGPVEHALAAPEAGMGERVVEGGAFADLDPREDFPLPAARQVGAGRRRGQEKRDLPCRERMGQFGLFDSAGQGAHANSHDAKGVEQRNCEQ